MDWGKTLIDILKKYVFYSSISLVMHHTCLYI